MAENQESALANTTASAGEENKSVARRHFLEGLGGTCGLLILGGVGRLLPALHAREARVRPPGAQNEKRFEALCVKCYRCEEVCHTQVIGVADARDGVVASRTPRMLFKVGWCDLCMKCVDVCPTGAIERFDKNKVRIGLAVVQKDLCIPWQWGGCTKCFEKCPAKAIKLDEQKRPIVDEAKCNGCGLCEKICPATELRSYSAGQQRGVVIVPPTQQQG